MEYNRASCPVSMPVMHIALVHDAIRIVHFHASTHHTYSLRTRRTEKPSGTYGVSSGSCGTTPFLNHTSGMALTNARA